MKIIIVCDDNPVHRQFFTTLLSRCPSPWCDQKIISCETVQQVQKALEIFDDISVIFMDIDLKGTNGILEIEKMQQHAWSIPVVYVTGIADYCSDVYRTNHQGLLLKPVKLEKLIQTLERVDKFHAEKTASKWLVAKSYGTIYRLPLWKILYLEKQLREIQIVTAEQTVSIYGRFADIQPQLDNRFIQCHTSFLINLDYIVDQSGKEFHLKNGVSIPISQKYLASCRENFWNYITEKNRNPFR